MDIETIIKIENDMRYKPDTFTGTEEEWAAVPIAQRAHYKIVNITDDLEAGKTTLNISTELTRLYGATVTITDGEETIIKTLSNSGTVTVEVHDVGVYTITCDIYTDSVNVARMGITIAHTIAPEIVSWSTGTDAQIVALIAAADLGDIDLYEDAGWRVGDERTISLAAMEAMSPLDDTHVAQDITWVLMHKGFYKRSSDNSTVNFVVGMKTGLSENGRMNTTNTNSGSWKQCSRRAWCNSVFKNAIPSSIRDIFKQVKVTTASVYNGSTNEQTDDYFFLAAAAEMYKGDSTYGTGGTAGDKTAYSNLVEFNALTRFDYYTNINNLPNNGYPYLWTRSPAYNDYMAFVAYSSGVTNSRIPVGVNASGVEVLLIHACI